MDKEKILERWSEYIQELFDGEKKRHKIYEK